MFNRFSQLSLFVLSGTFFLCPTIQAADEHPPMTPIECQKDFNFSSAFILKNDAGIRAKNWDDYPKNIQKVINEQKAKITQVSSLDACKEITNHFLKSIRKGHLSLGRKTISEALKESSTIQSSNLVTTQKLSEQTTLITIPTFDLSVKNQLEKIIQNNQNQVLNARYLILDVRKNTGGFDSSAEPLYALLGAAEYWFEMPEIYASTDNIQSWKETSKTLPDGEIKNELNHMIVLLERNKNSWVGMTKQKEEKQVIAPSDVKAAPQKIIILSDEDCASSCEMFILTARQNPNVLIMGRNTYGALDASNIRSIKTPSQQFTLYYATTFIHRRAGQQIDDLGIAPNIRLPKPQNPAEYDAEVKLAQHYLEDYWWK